MVDIVVVTVATDGDTRRHIDSNISEVQHAKLVYV